MFDSDFYDDMSDLVSVLRRIADALEQLGESGCFDKDEESFM